MESSSSVITPEDVMGTLMNDGTIDSMRLKIITQLKANEELKNTTIKMVEQSRVLNTPGAEKQTKRELFDALRQELDTVGLRRGMEVVVLLLFCGSAYVSTLLDSHASGKPSLVLRSNICVKERILLQWIQGMPLSL